MEPETSGTFRKLCRVATLQPEEFSCLEAGWSRRLPVSGPAGTLLRVRVPALPGALRLPCSLAPAHSQACVSVSLIYSCMLLWTEASCSLCKGPCQALEPCRAPKGKFKKKSRKTECQRHPVGLLAQALADVCGQADAQPLPRELLQWAARWLFAALEARCGGHAAPAAGAAAARQFCALLRALAAVLSEVRMACAHAP